MAGVVLDVGNEELLRLVRGEPREPFELTPLNEQEATLRMKEADDSGVALILTTHKERAELYQEQFTSKGLVVTIEPAE